MRSPVSRFVGDQTLLEELRAIPEFARGNESAEVIRNRDSFRAELLASAVKVDEDLLPKVTGSLARVAARLGDDDVPEAYVFPESTINAFVTRQGERLIVALSSGSVERLRDAELDFVVGHELGHARFGHLDVAAEFVLRSGALSAKDSMRLRAWQRAAEISADRAGLWACGSLDDAATAFFKMLSGLDVPEGGIDPVGFARQWDDLQKEVVQSGGGTHWQLSHPFPPLRMRAMCLFWEVMKEGASLDGGDAGAVDKKVDRMLATMDPGRSTDEDSLGDPILSPYLFWGGLYVALADRILAPEEIARLQSIAPSDVSLALLAEDLEKADAECLARFQEGIKTRRKKLSSVELHRIISGLADLAAADGHVDESETNRIAELGAMLGIPPAGCQLILNRALNPGDRPQ